MPHCSGAGRYAPSPSGPLHIGNLRTAFAAWAMARSTGRKFLLRIEDIDQTRTGAAEGQIRDLEQLGLDWDGEIVYQSHRLEAYRDALSDLARRDLLFECYCSRREIREAAGAPHVLPGHYPGTCLSLTTAQRERKREKLHSQGRVPALRLAPKIEMWTVTDEFHGEFQGHIDSLVLQRNDGGPAYNLAVVVDDTAFGIDQVVRGDDLLWTAPGQAYLTTLLGDPQPMYGHVPLVLNQQGVRLAKRDGPVTLEELVVSGISHSDIVEHISRSLGVDAARSAQDFLMGFVSGAIPREAYYFDSHSILSAIADPKPCNSPAQIVTG